MRPLGEMQMIVIASVASYGNRGGREPGCFSVTSSGTCIARFRNNRIHYSQCRNIGMKLVDRGVLLRQGNLVFATKEAVKMLDEKIVSHFDKLAKYGGGGTLLSEAISTILGES